MDIDRIQRGLTVWLKQFSGRPAVIENEPRPSLDRQTGFWIVSPPNAIRQLGEDCVEYADGVATVVGRRGFMCVIKYVCRDQAAARNARYWLEQARMALKRPAVRDHFRDVGIGVIEMRPTMTYDAPYDGRMESVAAAELHLTCGVRDSLGAENIGTIEHVEVASDMDTPADFADVIPPVSP